MSRLRRDPLVRRDDDGGRTGYGPGVSSVRQAVHADRSGRGVRAVARRYVDRREQVRYIEPGRQPRGRGTGDRRPGGRFPRRGPATSRAWVQRGNPSRSCRDCRTSPGHDRCVAIPATLGRGTSRRAMSAARSGESARTLVTPRDPSLLEIKMRIIKIIGLCRSPSVFWSYAPFSRRVGTDRDDAPPGGARADAVQALPQGYHCTGDLAAGRRGAGQPGRPGEERPGPDQALRSRAAVQGPGPREGVEEHRGRKPRRTGGTSTSPRIPGKPAHFPRPRTTSFAARP